jgi:hypothetical protein
MIFLVFIGAVLLRSAMGAGAIATVALTFVAKFGPTVLVDPRAFKI